jgi:hypothetical protein
LESIADATVLDSYLLIMRKSAGISPTALAFLESIADTTLI